MNNHENKEAFSIKYHLRIFFYGLICSIWLGIKGTKEAIFGLSVFLFAPLILCYFMGIKYSEAEIPEKFSYFLNDRSFSLASGLIIDTAALVLFVAYLIYHKT